MKFTTFYILFLILSSGFRFTRNRATRNREGGLVYFKPIFALQFWLYTGVLILAIIEFFIVGRRISPFVALFGLVIYLAGIVSREWTVKTLGEYWSADIRIREDHQLIKEGPYRYVRHPNLVCLLLEINGLCLIPNSYYSLMFVWLAYFPLILVRIHLEEKALIERFGQEYKNYRKEVFAFLPIKRAK